MFTVDLHIFPLTNHLYRRWFLTYLIDVYLMNGLMAISCKIWGKFPTDFYCGDIDLFILYNVVYLRKYAYSETINVSHLYFYV